MAESSRGRCDCRLQRQDRGSSRAIAIRSRLHPRSTAKQPVPPTSVDPPPDLWAFVARLALPRAARGTAASTWERTLRFAATALSADPDPPSAARLRAERGACLCSGGGYLVRQRRTGAGDRGGRQPRERTKRGCRAASASGGDLVRRIAWRRGPLQQRSASRQSLSDSHRAANLRRVAARRRS